MLDLLLIVTLEGGRCIDIDQMIAAGRGSVSGSRNSTICHAFAQAQGALSRDAALLNNAQIDLTQRRLTAALSIDGCQGVI